MNLLSGLLLFSAVQLAYLTFYLTLSAERRGLIGKGPKLGSTLVSALAGVTVSIAVTQSVPDVLVGALVFVAVQGALVLGYYSVPAERPSPGNVLKFVSILVSGLFAVAATVSGKAVVPVVSSAMIGAVVMTMALHKRYANGD